jgi:ATP-binding cassette subfamily B protein
VPKNALWRVTPYVRPHRWPILAVIVAAAGSIGASLAIPLVTKSVIDGPLADGDRAGLWTLAVIALVLAVVEGLCTWRRRRWLARIATGIERDLRNDLYRHLQRLDVGFHDGWQSGQLVQRCVSDIATIRRAVGFAAIFLVIIVAETLVVFVLLARLHLGLAALTMLAALPILLLLQRFERRWAVLSRRRQDQEGDLTTIVEEGATGLRAIKAFGRRRLVLERFDRQAEQVRQTGLERVRLLSLFDWLLGFVPNAVVAVVLLVGALAVGSGSLTVGGLVAFVLYLLLLIGPLEFLGWILAQVQEAGTAAERIFEVLDTEPVITERPGARTVAEVRGEVRFADVRFDYGNGTDILRGIDLVLEPGETVALVGVTGSGKTTLASLVPRLHDVSSGRVLVDGTDVRDFTVPSLRSHVGFAFEDPTLFSVSARENLLLGAPEATEADIEEALEIAQATFIHDLPWGLDTRIGEQGHSLSGGQRQRLALARAIIGRPRVLVLDDPLSALDVHTEALVEDALRQVLQGVTALLVVHRPSTVALADRAALLHGGRIVATGTHSELMATEPEYQAVLAQEVETDEVATGEVSAV